MTQLKPRAIGFRLLFASLAVVSLIGGDFLTAGIWFGLALGMLILGSEATPWAQIPTWRRVLGSLAVVVTLLLFIVEIARAILS